MMFHFGFGFRGYFSKEIILLQRGFFTTSEKNAQCQPALFANLTEFMTEDGTRSPTTVLDSNVFLDFNEDGREQILPHCSFTYHHMKG